MSSTTTCHMQFMGPKKLELWVLENRGPTTRNSMSQDRRWLSQLTKREGVFLPPFVLSALSVHWLVPTHIGEGNPLLYQLIQTLISSRNNLKNTARLSYLHIPSPDWQSRNYGKRDCTKIRRSSLPCVGDSALAEASMSSTQSFWLLCLNSDEIQL